MSRVSDETLREISEGAFFGRDIDMDLACELRKARDVVKAARQLFSDLTVDEPGYWPVAASGDALRKALADLDALEDGE